MGNRLCRTIVLAAFLLGCAYAAAASETTGRLQGTAAGVEVDVEGRCSIPQEGYLRFLSDKWGTSDTDGDGFVVQVVKSGNTWVLMLESDGEAIYKGSPGEFTKEGEGYRLAKKLKRRAQADEIDVDLLLTCQR